MKHDTSIQPLRWLAALCLFSTSTPAGVFYVSVNSTNATLPYGTWANAASNIQDAVDAAVDGDLVLVTNGDYNAGGRVIYGTLTNRVAINKAVTVQSVNGPGATRIRGSFFIGDNAARGVYMTNNAALSGFTVVWGATRSAGDTFQEQSGGGIWCESTSATISNCVISGNSAYISGGGVINGALVNCTITGNAASKVGGESTAGAGGGALYSTLNHCTINGNSAFAGGGVAYGTLDFCTVSGNAATASFNSGNYFLTGGGGVLDGVANNCRIIGNSAYIGGGFYGYGFPSGALNNCLVASNYVAYPYGGAGGTYDGTMNNCTLVGNSGGQSAGALFGTLNNCVAYYNSGQNFSGGTLNNCCTIPMPTNGVANFTNAPMFVNPANEFHLLPNSPCIDAGNNAYVTTGADLDGNPRIVGASVDVGAYEYQDLPIFVITQPASQTKTIGQTVSLGVLATSPLPLGYQWRFNQTNILGATNASLTLSNIQLSASGVYSVLLSNAQALLFSSNASLTVAYPPPSVLSQPTGAVLFVGLTAAFSATVLSYSPVAFQWYFNGTPLADGGRVSGSTTTNLAIANLQTNDAGSYWLVATNDYGSATSASATLTVLPLTTASVQPPNLTSDGGATATFSALVTGQGPFTYQWQFNGTNLVGATNSSLTLTNLLDSQSGGYAITVSNAAGTIVSSEAPLTVVPWVVASIQNSPVLAGSGSYAFFSLSSAGFSTNAVYQWQLNGTNRDSSWTWTSPGSFRFLLPLMGDAGAYDVVASDPYATATSSNVTLTVIPLAITTQPQSQSSVGGATATLSVVAPGQAPLAFQWQFNGVAIPNATNTSFVLSNLALNQSGTYSVTVTNLFAGVASSNATLTVAPLAVTTQPTNRVAWPNGAASFKVNVSGQSPLSFDWRLDGADLALAATNVLTLTNLQSAQFGAYDVVVSNSFGSVTSGVAALILSQVAIWGTGAYGETNLTAGLTNLIAIATGTAGTLDCVALRGDGTVITWPTVLAGFQLTGVTNLIAIAGAVPTYGLRANGAVVEWTYDGAFAIPALTNIAAISAFPSSSYLALRNDGTVPPPPPGGLPAGLSNLVATAAGGGHSLALKADGTVMAWGNNSSGQATVPAGLSNVVAIAAGAAHSLALKSNGTVFGWGLNASGQTSIPPGLSNVVAIAAGPTHSLALKANGTVVAWGLNSSGQTNVPPGLTNAIAIAAGTTFSMALLGNGPPVTQALLSNPEFKANPRTFTLSLPTQSGRVYVLEYKTSLADTTWTSLPLVPGNGGPLLLTDPSATNAERFYRVQRW